MQKVAIMVDGGFFQKRYATIVKGEHSAKDVAGFWLNIAKDMRQ